MKDSKKAKQLKKLEKKNYSFNEKVVSDLKYAFMCDFTVERACRYAGISKDTYYRWLQESDVFTEEMEKAKDYMLNTSLKVIKEAIEDKENLANATHSAKWVLERRDKKRFAERSEMTDGQGNPLNFGLKDMLKPKESNDNV